MEIVCFMPIRLNSQRIKNKSIVNVLGRPMFCWSLETLDKLNIPVYVYTNNIVELKNLIDFEQKNIHWLERPEYLDGHDVQGIDIYKEFAKTVSANYYLLCHCTSPFVKLESYQKCIDSVITKEYDSAMTVRKEQTFTWYKNQPLNFNLPRKKTQELEPIYIETSAAYCYSKEILELNSRSSFNPKLIITSGLEVVDIDNSEDLEMFYKLSEAQC